VEDDVLEQALQHVGQNTSLDLEGVSLIGEHKQLGASFAGHFSPQPRQKSETQEGGHGGLGVLGLLPCFNGCCAASPRLPPKILACPPVRLLTQPPSPKKQPRGRGQHTHAVKSAMI